MGRIVIILQRRAISLPAELSWRNSLNLSQARGWLVRVRNADNFRLVLVTAPDLRTARRLASAALKARLIACANIVKHLESHYRWKGKLEKSPETLLLLKTPSRQLTALEKLILEKHPYDTPEFLVLKLSAGNARYLKWLSSSCR